MQSAPPFLRHLKTAITERHSCNEVERAKVQPALLTHINVGLEFDRTLQSFSLSGRTARGSITHSACTVHPIASSDRKKLIYLALIFMFSFKGSFFFRIKCR